MKIAIIHDFLNQYGGAERCVEVFHEIFPVAPIFTSIYLSKNLPKTFRSMDIRTSFMQKLPCLNKHFKKYLPVYPLAFESLDLSKYDVILSSSSAFAKGVKKRKGTRHLCYCYTPMRFVWDYERYIEKEDLGSLVKSVLPLAITHLKQWDLRSNGTVDEFISISNYIRDRIRRCYGRDSIVIYPPVNVSDYKISDSIDEYFLVVSRLNAYKRIDIAVEAFNELKLPLKIIGDGPCREQLQKMAKGNIEFLGKVNEKTMIEAYEKCRAFIFPGEEDFGIVPVEAQAAGRPVIAFAAGGALETIIENVTGVFFKETKPKALCDAVKQFIEKERSFDPVVIRKNAMRFDKEVFKNSIREYIMNTKRSI